MTRDDCGLTRMLIWLSWFLETVVVAVDSIWLNFLSELPDLAGLAPPGDCEAATDEERSLSCRGRQVSQLRKWTNFERERESSSLGFLCSWKAMVINPLLANSQRRETTATEETLFSSAASALPRMKFLTRQNTKNRTFYLETFYFEKKMFASLKY